MQIDRFLFAAAWPSVTPVMKSLLGCSLIVFAFVGSCTAQDAVPSRRSRTRAAMDLLVERATKVASRIEGDLIGEYQKLREEFVEKNRELRLGSNRDSEQRRRAGAFFDQLRDDLVGRYRDQDGYHRSQFPPARPFPLAKTEIAATESFRWIRRMPKGGLLHTHSTSTGRADWIAQNVAQMEGCYIYWPPEGAPVTEPTGKIIFDEGKPPKFYRAAKELAAQVDDFEARMTSLLQLQAEDFSGGQGLDPWHHFNDVFGRMVGFITHQPAFQAYFEDALETLIADGIDHVEMRTGMGTLTDLDGNTWAEEAFIGQYQEVMKRVQERHPDFTLKLIINDGRGRPAVSVDRELQLAIRMRELYPDFVIGFDLVGQETSQNPTRDYLSVWMKYKKCVAGPDEIPLYFHDGETDWADNDNVIDALLLGSRRIGHGFNLVCYPEVERRMREQGIALEVCPISNQMLRYVRDLRIHPACGYIRRGIPCVLGSDDPLIFGNEGLSYDFWIAWMAWDLTLDDLRQLAADSIRYSGLSKTEKRKARNAWNQKWDVFEAQLAAAAGPLVPSGGKH